MKITQKILENLIKEELNKLLAEETYSYRDKMGIMRHIGPGTTVSDRDLYNRARDAVYNAPAKPKKATSLQVGRPVGAEPIRGQEGTLDSLMAHLGSSDRVKRSPVDILEASGPYGIKDDSGNIAKQYMAYTIKLFFETDDSQKLKK